MPGPARTFTPINIWDVRLNAGAKFAWVERLGEVVVGAGGKALDLGLDGALRGQHEYWDTRSERIGFNTTADFESVQPRHGVIEDDEVGLACLDGGEGGVAVFDEVDLVARGPKEVAKHQAHLFVVVGEKQVTHESTEGCA